MQIPQILDCTIRDGGYMTNWHFDNGLVRDVYRAVSKAGIDYVELGYHGTTHFFDPKKYGTWRFSPEAAIRKATQGIQGAHVGFMVDFGKFDPADIPPRDESVVELIRIAVHRDKVRQAVGQANQLKAKGYKISLQLMGFATYTQAERQELKHILTDAPLDFVYVADSYGSTFPDQIESFLETLKSIGSLRVGFHPHNQLQTAFANTLEAIRCGVDIIDGSIYGIGRAAGNLPLETLIAYLQTQRPDRFNVLPLLNIIDRYFMTQQQETPWGYQLPYMLSGLFNVHPNYAKDLIARREYTIEDIWKALQVVKQQNPVGFSRDLLDSLIARGLVGNFVYAFPEVTQRPVVDEDGAELATSAVTYADRHQGRDFLVLANGPSLRTHVEQIREFIRRYDPVVMGANYLGGLFVPHYHAFNNKRRFIDYVDQVDPQSSLLLGSNFDEAFIREHTTRDFGWLIFQNQLADFDIVNGVITSNCRTISVLLCGVALVMGARRIFVVGMDGYIGLDTSGRVHFYPETDEPSNPEILLERHQRNYYYLGQINDYAEAHDLEGIHILTPTGYAKFYKGISNYLDIH